MATLPSDWRARAVVHAGTRDEDAHDAFARLEALLVTIAGALAADRSEATAYSHCRTLLLGSDYRRALPGFVVQCISVFRFREFISLLDPAPATRQEFVRAALADGRSVRSRFGAEAAPRPRSLREWTL